MPTRPTTPVDLADPSLYSRGIPQAVFEEVRAVPGLSWNPIDGDVANGFWAVTRHRDVVEVSRDTTTYSSEVGHIQLYDIDADALDARASMIDMDPPMHTRLRRIVSSAFTPRHVQGYRPAIEQRVSSALGNLIEEGGGDWVKLVAAPIPIGVICDMMGVPESDHGYMIELSDHLVAGTSSEPLDPGAYGNTTALRLLPFNSPAAHGINEYAKSLNAKKRANPADDLMSKLVRAEIDGETLTDAELANFFRLMIFAGNETTRSAMSHLALHLVEFASEFDRVRTDSNLLDSATEEVIRYSSPILYFRRTATCDVELAGTQVLKGEKLVMWYSAADFDETVFDDPQRFDVARPTPPPNVAFGGGGAHFCLGASLARLELSILIEEILRRQIQLDIVGGPTFVDSNFVNGIEHLQVAVK